MASKPNIRSIRFSDELAELIDRQARNTFTEKFANRQKKKGLCPLRAHIKEIGCFPTTKKTHTKS